MAEQNLCNYSQEEIIKALEMLKDICTSNHCSACPFGYNGDHCRFREWAPCDFDIGKSSHVWRALE